jgi:YqaJ-like viral recombinase domain
MIIVECQQGAPDWHRARAGAITASMFSEVRKRVGGLTEQQALYVDAIKGGATPDEAKAAAGYKSAPRSTTITKALAGEPVGDFTEAAKAYAFRLAIERISGNPLDEADQFETYAMRRGRELEPEARAAHEFARDITVTPCGIVLTDDGKFGGSADGLIGDNAGAEYKCLIDPTRIRDVILGGDLSEFQDQIQGCMWLTGRATWHFCLYVPALASIGLALTVFVVQRDDNYIAEMERDLLEFDALVCEYVERLSRVKNLDELAQIGGAM